MVKLQLAANAIAKSRSQIKPKPVKGSSINTILIFFMAGNAKEKKNKFPQGKDTGLRVYLWVGKEKQIKGIELRLGGLT